MWKIFSLENLFSDSAHKSTIFNPAQVEAVEAAAYTKSVRGKPTPFIKCLVRGKEIRLTPEEAVRQMFIRKLVDEYGYKISQMAVEHAIHFGREVKRADIVIFEQNRPTVEYIIVEVKKPKLKDSKEQLKSYCNATGATMGVWSNGEKISFYHRKDPNYFEDIPDIPRAAQKLKDILRERRTIDNLIADDKLLRENKTLAELIRELEDEVLANAGVDVFEEVFKLSFPVHTTFYIRKKILDAKGISQSHLFSLEAKPPECEDYVNENIFAIDFDEKTVRVARTLNLIAGDGKTNVLHLNTLDYERWGEAIDDDWNDIYFEGWKKLRKLRAAKDDNSRFNFDIVMANPPFAGDIKESRIIAKYELGKNSRGKYQSKVGRDILFIERNLNFLKPGGRMAIILPQGRLNNLSDKYIRDFIAEQGRILAVVGLHGNVFKPHTGTKTSVLFVQKWHDELCPRRDDYPIFFATMREPSKDNSGEKILEVANGELLRDTHHHTIVKHDLFNHDGLTRDGIAEAFIEFAKRERLSFFEQSSFDAARYKILSEELECTEINFSYVHSDIFRLDSFFYAKEFLKGEELIAKLNTTSLREMKRATILSFGAYSLNNFVEYLSAAAHKLLYKSEVFPETVLLSMSGSVGNVAIALPSWKYPINSNQDIAKIHLRGEMNPYYLYAFFASRYGQNYMRREARGSVQQHVFLSQIESFRIPVPSDSFADEVEKICKAGFSCKERADESYHAAEKILEQALGLDNFKASKENVAIKSFNASFMAGGRLDAEFYQPKYDDLKKFMTSVGTVGELCKVHDKNFTPHDKKVYRYIELANVESNGNISTPEEILGEELPTRARRLVKAGQVIISSIEGSLQNCALITDELGGALCSTGFFVVDSENFNAATLLVLFKSELMQNLMRQQCTGTILTAVSRENFLNLPLPSVAQEIQEQIAAQVAESFRLRRESEALLFKAKRAVELAIEQGEDAAINFLGE